MIQHRFATQIAQLIAADVVTHIIDHAHPIDALFALSKARDFPQVSFAAAFDDGTIAIGCHDKLPAELAGMAQPVTIDDDPFAAILEKDRPGNESSEIKISDVAEKIDALTAVVANWAKSSDADPDLAGKVDTLLQLQTTSPGSGRFDDIDDRLRNLTHVLEKNSEFDDVIKPLKDGQDQIMRAVDALRPSQSTNEIARLLQLVEANIDSELHASDALAAGLADIAETCKVTQQRVTHLDTDFKTFSALHAMHESQKETGHVLPDRIVENIAILPGLQADLAQINATLETLSNDSDVSAAIAKLTADLSYQISQLADRPVPRIDLTEQRQTLARFQTAMGTVLGRLEKAIGQANDASAKKDQADHAKIMSQLSIISDGVAPIGNLPPNLEQIGQALQGLPEKADALSMAIEALQNRPDPVLDLTAQRAGFAQFGTALGTIVQRLECVVQKFSDQIVMDASSDRLSFDQTISDETLADVDEALNQDEPIAQTETPFSFAGSDTETLRLLRTNLAEAIAMQLMLKSLHDDMNNES